MGGISDKYKVVWTIKGEDLHLGEDLPGRGLGNQMTQQRRVSSFEKKSSLGRQEQSILKHTEEPRGKKMEEASSQPFLHGGSGMVALDFM